MMIRQHYDISWQFQLTQIIKLSSAVGIVLICVVDWYEPHLLRVGVAEVDLIINELLSVVGVDGVAHRLGHHLPDQLESLHHTGGGEPGLGVVVPALLDGLTQHGHPAVFPPLLLQVGTNFSVDDKI